MSTEPGRSGLSTLIWQQLYFSGSISPIFWFDPLGLFDGVVDNIQLPIQPERLSIERAFHLRLESVGALNPLAERLFYVRDNAATEPLREIIRCFGVERLVTLDHLLRSFDKPPSLPIQQFAQKFSTLLISRWSSIPLNAFQAGAIDAGIAAAAAGATSLDPVEIAVAHLKGRRVENRLAHSDPGNDADAAIGEFLGEAFGFDHTRDAQDLRANIARTALLGELLHCSATRSLVVHLMPTRLHSSAERLGSRIADLTSLTSRLEPDLENAAKALAINLDALSDETLFELRLFPGARHRAVERVRQELIGVNAESAAALLTNREQLLDEDLMLQEYKAAHFCLRDMRDATTAIGVSLGAVEKYFERYAEDWFRIDQLYRRAMAGVEGGVKKALQVAYRSWLRDLNGAFNAALEARETWTFKNAQREFGMALNNAKEGVAVVVMDALRYELGCELRDRLGKSFDVTVDAGVASLPSITEVGMSALVPSSDAMRFEVKANKLHVFVGNRETTVKSARDALWENAGFRVYDAQDAAIVSTSDHRVVVFHGAVDAIGEKLQGDFFGPLEHLVTSLAQLFRDLSAKGFEVIGVSDHGFLTLPPLDASGHINPGVTDDEVKKRRYRVSASEALDPPVLTRSATALGVVGDVSVGFPPASSILSAHGALTFLHGGISLQEMVIPFIRVQAKGKKNSDWELVFPESLRARSVRVRLAPRTGKNAATMVRLGVWREESELAGREVPIPENLSAITLSALLPDGVAAGPLLLKVSLVGGALIAEKRVIFEPERE